MLFKTLQLLRRQHFKKLGRLTALKRIVNTCARYYSSTRACANSGKLWNKQSTTHNLYTCTHKPGQIANTTKRSIVSRRNQKHFFERNKNKNNINSISLVTPSTPIPSYVLLNKKALFCTSTNSANNDNNDNDKYILPRDVNKLNDIILSKWENNTYVEQMPLKYLPSIPSNINLTAWECMMLHKLTGEHLSLGEFIIAFPPYGSPSELMKHFHGGGRIITTISGNGLFSCEKNGKWYEYKLSPGTRVFFPKNTPHTFMGYNNEAILVHAIHTPYYNTNDPRSITYLHTDDKNKSVHSIEYPPWDPKDHFPDILN